VPLVADIMAHGEPAEAPMYLYQPHDLPRAGLLLRMPFLSTGTIRSAGRQPCAWCHAAESDWGHHLIRCPEAPLHVVYQRDQALAAIYADVDPAKRAVPDGVLSAANLTRLYRLTWPGVGPTRSRLRHRSDEGEQPSGPALRMALWYFRTCLNAYSAASPRHPRLGTPTVAALRVYGRSPFGPMPQ
jgi:hypothetical protein